MAKFDSPQEERAYAEMLAANEDYSQAMRALTRGRKILPPEESRTPAETVFWTMLRMKVSNTSKAARKAEQKYFLSKGGRKELDTLERIKELLEDVETPTELQKAEKRYNPFGMDIERIPDLKIIADAARANEAKKQAREYKGMSQEELDAWMNSPSPEPKAAESEESKEAEDGSVSSVE